MSPAAAAQLLNVAPMTLSRMGEPKDGRLTRYKISGTITVYWRPEVERLAMARRIARQGDR
jgi:hypothetical protein